MTTVAMTDLAGDYTLDVAHTTIGFVARHAMVTKVRGAFNEFAGAIHYDPADSAKSTATVSIKAASIDTRNKQRDAHLRSNDFLAMDEHPDITFVSTDIGLAGGTVSVTGDLAIRGVSKPVTIDFTYEGAATDPYGDLRVGLAGSVTIDRKDFGVNWNAALEAGGVLVGDKVVLEIEVSAIKIA